MGLIDYLRPLLRDDRLTRGLGDAEASQLVAWVVEQSERPPQSLGHYQRIAQRGRAIGRFVVLWCAGEWAAATQLAGAERFAFPLPTDFVDAGDLMDSILRFETLELAV